MKRHLTRSIALIALAAPLGGCNSFLGIHFARHARSPEPVQAEAPAAAAAQSAAAATEAGRRQLAAGQTGLAIGSFRDALAKGEPVAPAANGLGVAYARLGRFETALQYFQQAAAADPADQRYEANISRLMQSPTFAMRREGDMAAGLLRAEQAANGAAAAQTAQVAPVIGKLQRVSRGEVRIVTASPAAAPLRAARVDARFRPLARITFAEPAGAPVAAAAGTGAKVDARFRPLVRMTLPEQASPSSKTDAPTAKGASR